MNYLFIQLKREWHFLLRQKYALALLACTFVISAFAVYSGLSEVSQQQQTIAHLKVADTVELTKVQNKHSNAGTLGYYGFHLTYLPPSKLAFAALGERDIYPWKHRINLLALEGQIYESDAQNAELAQAGKIDFNFVLTALAPLIIILLFHDLFSSERSSGRYDLLVTTAQSALTLWGARIAVRFIAVMVCLMGPFYLGALLSSTTVTDIGLVFMLCVSYLIFWTALSVWWGKNASSSPRVASTLIGFWVLVAFIIPILADLAIEQAVHSPKGGDIVLTQREAVNDAWDIPKATTMNAFVKHYPEFTPYSAMGSKFEWKWYYAFQQLGDLKAAELSLAYRKAARKKYQLAGVVAWLSPPLLLQRNLTRMANTDALAAFQYEQQIRDFHQSLRAFYYPWLFTKGEPTKHALSTMPRFKSITEQQ
jgi:ABC-2 type transport system permease protein